MGVSEFLSEAEKMQFLNSVCKIWCLSFANILLKIRYSFPMKLLAIIMSIPPTFNFHFSFTILAIIMPIPLTFPVLMPLPNYNKRFSIEGKTDLSEGRVPPQKLIEIMQFSKSIFTPPGTRRYSDTP